MKTTLINSLILASAMLAGLGAVDAAFEQQPSLNAGGMQSVSIVASRMSAAEKLAYDQAQLPMQTVQISAKRLSAAEKLALDKQDMLEQQKLARGNTGAVRSHG